MDAQSPGVPEDSGAHGAAGDRSVCLSPDKAIATLLQLEGGPRGSSHRCIHAGLVSPERFREPTLVPDQSLPLQGESRRSANSASNTSVEYTTLVSSSTGNVGGLLSTADQSTRSGSIASGSGVSLETGSSSTDRLAHLRQSYSSQGLSSEGSDLMLASWRDKTNSNYGSSFSKWAGWCQRRSRNPYSGSVADVVNFLAELFSQGYQYQSLNCCRSAISSVHEKVDGNSIGVHPAVTRLLKGAFHSRPPQPRYSSFWDVSTVISYLQSLGDNDSLNLRHLTLKTVMLLALTRPSRSADLAKLDIQWMSYQADSVTFRPAHLAKQSRSSIFPLFKDDPFICPVTTLRAYEERTKEFRDLQSPSPKTTLFLSWIRKHNPVTSSTIARWLKLTMSEAGIDVGIFKSHSACEATCSKAAGAGVTAKQILEAADWSSEGTFQWFYHRKVEKDDRTSFGTRVLSSHSASNHTC